MSFVAILWVCPFCVLLLRNDELNKTRPINLQLTTIKFPLPAIASILHRASGVILVIMIPFLLFLLQASLASEDSFGGVQTLLSHPVTKFVFWGILSSLGYHLVAGIRHLLMDVGVGESKSGGRRGAFLAIVIGAVLAVLMGGWLW